MSLGSLSRTDSHPRWSVALGQAQCQLLTALPFGHPHDSLGGGPGFQRWRGDTEGTECQVWTADECPLLPHVIADYWRTEGLGMGQGPEARSQEARAEGRGLGRAWRLCPVQRRARTQDCVRTPCRPNLYPCWLGGSPRSTSLRAWVAQKGSVSQVLSSVICPLGPCSLSPGVTDTVARDGCLPPQASPQ